MAERGKARVRRADPERTGPIRNAASLLRGERTSAPAEESDEPVQPRGRARAGAKRANADVGAAWSDTVAHGVDAGYRVVEEQLRQGRRIAEELAGGRGYGAAFTEGGVRDLGERTMRYYGDLLALWMEALDTLLVRRGREPDADAADDGHSPPRRRAGGAGARARGASPKATAGATTAIVEVASKRPAQVTLSLDPEAADAVLDAGPLVAHGSGAAALTDVVIERVPGQAAPVVRVRVPDEQPPGRYNGVVVDAESGLPLGTLSVRIAE